MQKLRGCALLLFCGALSAYAEMRMLHPVPNALAAGERAALSRQEAQLLASGHTLCAEYSVFLNACQGNDSSDCQQQFRRINEELSTFNSAADTYNAGVVAAMQRQVDKNLALVRSDQQAIRQLGIYRTAHEFDAWSEWLKSADDERQRQVEEAFQEAAKAVAGEALDRALDAGAEKFESFTPQTARKLTARLKSLGADNPDLLDAITALGNAKNKAAKAASARRLYEGLKKGKELWDLHDIAPDNESEYWKVGDELIENFVPDKRMKLIGKLTLNEVRATFYTVNEAAFDMPVFNRRLDQLNQLTAVQFVALRELSARLVKDVRAGNDARRGLRQLDQQPAIDVCNTPADLSGVPVAMNCVGIHRPGSAPAGIY